MIEDEKKLIQLMKWMDNNRSRIKEDVLDKMLEIYQTEVK